MKNLILLLIFLSPLCFCSCSGPKKIDSAEKPEKIGKVDFTTSESLFDILDKAEAQGKLAYVDVGTTWCLPCKLMQQDVYTDQDVADFLNEHFINYKVDAEKGNGPNIASIYEVSGYPTLLFMDAQGRVLVRKLGAAMQTELVELAQQAIDERDKFQ